MKEKHRMKKNMFQISSFVEIEIFKVRFENKYQNMQILQGSFKCGCMLLQSPFLVLNKFFLRIYLRHLEKFEKRNLKYKALKSLEKRANFCVVCLLRNKTTFFFQTQDKICWHCKLIK